jgi:hypothetical protein
MKLGVITAAILIAVPGPVRSSEDWGPDLVHFDLEGGSKVETMLWISGFSYSSTELLQSVGCLKKGQTVGSKELILALNNDFRGQKIDSEMASNALGLYLRSSYACAAYDQ